MKRSGANVPNKIAKRKTRLTPARLLEIDQALNRLIDSSRRNALPVMLQGALDTIRGFLDSVSVWVYVDGPRTFDQRPRRSILRYDSCTDKSLQEQVPPIVAEYRKTSESSGRPASEWETLTEEVDGHYIHAVPMYVDNPITFVGLLGTISECDVTPDLSRAIKQASTRIDTLVCFKNMSAEHQTVLSKANNALDKKGLGGIGQTVVLLELLARARRAGLVYLEDLYDDSVPAFERKVEIVFAEDGQVVTPPQTSFILQEGLGGNLIEYDGRVSDSRKAMMALGIIDRAGEKPRYFHTVTLFDRTEEPYKPIGKLFLIGGPPIDDTDTTIMQSVAMQLDTKLVHNYEMKRTLRRSLSEDQVEFFIHHPKIANWFFETPRNVEIAMVYTDIVGYTNITRRLNDPSATIRIAKNWILKEIELTAKHGGYFDKDIGDCAVSLFGPPFYELSIQSLLEAEDSDDLERLMAENPPNQERYAFQAVMYALESVAAIRNVQMGGSTLEISVGIEVQNVAIGDLNGNMGSLTAMGDGMNLAARLQGVAGAGQIVIGPGCREKLEDYRKNILAKSLPFRIDEGSAADLKGYEKPVQYYLVSPNPDE